MTDIAVEHISYQIHEQMIINDLSLQVNRGERLALLGHNGSGKTTLINIMTGLIKADRGKVTYTDNKKSFDKIKNITGIIWDNISIFPLLKVNEVVHFIAHLYSIDSDAYTDTYHLLELQDIQNKFMRKLSRGEKKRVEILLSTMHSPRLLIMDEPMASIDPLLREKIWNNIFLKNKTLFFTTHQWEEAKKYATSIAMIHKGRLLNKPASYKELLASFKFTIKIITTKDVIPDNSNDTFLYENEKTKIALLQNKHDPIIDYIRQKTVNYSIMPVELEDIYRYLIKTKE
ncbi:MAG TPA: ABC transporter ATP-binding protein [Balneolales bacterium]|nr:ABC transporter ATP-binding protein [Balneolales bacterium]